MLVQDLWQRSTLNVNWFPELSAIHALMSMQNQSIFCEKWFRIACFIVCSKLFFNKEHGIKNTKDYILRSKSIFKVYILCKLCKERKAMFLTWLWFWGRHSTASVHHHCPVRDSEKTHSLTDFDQYLWFYRHKPGVFSGAYMGCSNILNCSVPLKVNKLLLLVLEAKDFESEISTGVNQRIINILSVLK